MVDPQLRDGLGAWWEYLRGRPVSGRQQPLEESIRPAPAINLPAISKLGTRTWVVVGGGRAADVVRQWDQLHALTPAAAHRLAIDTMRKTAGLVQELTAWPLWRPLNFMELTTAPGGSQPDHSLGATHPVHSLGATHPAHPLGATHPVHPLGATHPAHSLGATHPTHPLGATHDSAAFPTGEVRPTPLSFSLSFPAIVDLSEVLQQTDHLPASWDVTSDSIALWLAHVRGASNLTLLKAVSPLEKTSNLDKLLALGWVDPFFPRLLYCPLERQPGSSGCAPAPTLPGGESLEVESGGQTSNPGGLAVPRNAATTGPEVSVDIAHYYERPFRLTHVSVPHR